ncbi:hypothetical protein GJ496_003796 [Pomphorhynchus laevis]|nr:hypothetical protein GJ496_003796 [Pomphorhynchus laevis]
MQFRLIKVLNSCENLLQIQWIRHVNQWQKHLHLSTNPQHDILQEDHFKQYSYYTPRPLSLRQLVYVDDLDMSFSYLRTEIPIRIAQLMKGIQCLPKTDLININETLRKQLIEKYMDNIHKIIDFNNCHLANPSRPAVKIETKNLDDINYTILIKFEQLMSNIHSNGDDIYNILHM